MGVHVSKSGKWGRGEREEKQGGIRTLAVDGVWVIFDRDTGLGVGWFTPQGAGFLDDFGGKSFGCFNAAIIDKELSHKLFDEEVVV